MPKFFIKKHRPIWETTTVTVVTPNPLPHGQRPEDWVIEHAEKLLDDAISDHVTVDSGDSVADKVAEIEIYDEGERLIFARPVD